MRGCTQWKPARVLDGKLYMVVLVNFLSDRCYSKKALLNADAALLLIPKHPVSAIKLIIGTPKQGRRGLGFARLDLLYQKEWVHFVVLNNFFRKKLKKCDRHRNSLANTLIKHRKNCECCPGHHLIVNHYSSMS